MRGIDPPGIRGGSRPLKEGESYEYISEADAAAVPAGDEGSGGRMMLALRMETGENHGSVKRVAEQPNIGVELLRSRVTQHETDHGARQGTSTVDAERIA